MAQGMRYSGKAHEPGGTVQAVSAPDGFHCGSRKIGQIVKAALVLTHAEHGRLA